MPRHQNFLNISSSVEAGTRGKEFIYESMVSLDDFMTSRVSICHFWGRLSWESAIEMQLAEMHIEGFSSLKMARLDLGCDTER